MPITGVTEPLKLIPYYCLNHSTWPLSNNIEVTCRHCRVKPGKSLTSQDQQLYIKTHTKASPKINKSQFITIHPSKVHYYKPSLLHKGNGSEFETKVDTSSGCWSQKELSTPKEATSSVSISWRLTTSVLKSAHSGWSGWSGTVTRTRQRESLAAWSPSPRRSEA
jgi:hypothetical protein